MKTPDPIAGGVELHKVEPPYVPPIEETPADRKAREERNLVDARIATRNAIHGRTPRKD